MIIKCVASQIGDAEGTMFRLRAPDGYTIGYMAKEGKLRAFGDSQQSARQRLANMKMRSDINRWIKEGETNERRSNRTC